MKPTQQQIDALFERGTIAEVIPSQKMFAERLRNGKPLHIYLGIDPTSDRLHLGHIQNVLFLEDLRRLGVRVTLLFGSFTGLIGDPSDRDSARPQLTARQLRWNMRTWKKQVAPILNVSWLSGARITYNNRWFDLFSTADLLMLMRGMTVQQLLERDMFQKRIKDGKPLHAHELVYPILQGYDSVAMRVDAELCGTDQTFNALVGRTMVKRYLNKEKFVVAMRLLEADGVLMSKSTGTGVFVDIDSGGEHRMFGAIMALPDSFILPLFKACTRVPMSEIAALDVSGGLKTRDAKRYLARTIVGMFFNKKTAKRAEKRYMLQFSEKGTPEDIPVIHVADGEKLISIVAKNTSVSNAEAKRKIVQGAVSLNNEKITDVHHTIRKKDGEQIVRIGRSIFRIT